MNIVPVRFMHTSSPYKHNPMLAASGRSQDVFQPHNMLWNGPIKNNVRLLIDSLIAGKMQNGPFNSAPRKI